MMKMIKTAILGGSFDPVHLGHLFLLHQSVVSTDYRRFILMPAALSNFKQNAKPKSSDMQRLKMLKLAVQDYKELYVQDEDVEIEVSDYELTKGGISYTYDTVIALKKIMKITDRIGFIIGDDHIETLNQWYKYDELKKEVEFIICPRNRANQSWDCLDSELQYIRLNPENIASQSSTAIRKNLRDNENYLSKRVLEYVKSNNLYN